MKIGLIRSHFLICLSPFIGYCAECVESDRVNGTGTMVYSSGHRFTGGFKEGLRHGEGVLLMPGERKIVGLQACHLPALAFNKFQGELSATFAHKSLYGL